MKEIEYNIPVFENKDKVDLKNYSEKMASAIKTQIDKFGNPLIFKGTVNTLAELEELENIKNGEIFAVKSEGKNFVWNGENWLEYSENIGISPLENKLNSLISSIKELHTPEEVEGENLTLENCDGRKFEDFQIFGRSEQEIREGYNLLNVDEEISITTYKEIPINLKAGTYTFQFEEATSNPDNNVSFISFRNDVEVNEKNIDTSTVKSFSIELNDNVTNVRIYTGTDYNNSLNKTKTFKKLMIYEGTEEKEYQKYGVMPSPEFPSEIKNVGDNVNLFDKKNPSILNAYIDKVLVSEQANRCIWLKCKGNTSYVIQKKPGKRFAIGFSTEKPSIGISVDTAISQNEAGNLVAKSPENANYIIIYVANYNAPEETDWQEILESLKVEEGSVLGRYTDFNVANLTFTISNKNIFNTKEFIDFFNLKKGQDLEHKYISYTTKKYSNIDFMKNRFKENTQYILSFKGRQSEISSEGVTSGFVFSYTDGSSDSITIDNDISWKNYELLSNPEKTIQSIRMSWSHTGTIWISNIQLEEMEKTEFVENKQQKIIFPLKEGQRLYKDSFLAADGIHHIRKQKVFKGTEKWQTTGTSTISNTLQIYIDKEDIQKIYNITHFSLEQKVNGIYVGNTLNFYPSTTIIKSLSDWKTYLSNQSVSGKPLTVEYGVDEYVEPYTTEQQAVYATIMSTLRNYKGITHIYSEDETSPIFKVKHYKDIYSILEQKKESNIK